LARSSGPGGRRLDTGDFAVCALSNIRGRPAIALSLFVIVLAFEPLAAYAQAAPIVKTSAGDIQGIAERDVFAFKGIPYAAPPVGDLRWREPEPAAAWQGVRKGDAFGNACIQAPGLAAANGGDPGPFSEDCLFLNVWTPKADSSANLPVMVWIHGGAFIFGSGSQPVYDGAPLAKKGTVVVTINYRLAQLGFFAHPALEKESPGGPVNFGLLDQIAALKWVRQNIAQFGGNPGNVTILDQSAGGKSIVALFASPLARGLFHKGIAMSSPAVPNVTRAKAREVGVKVAEALNLNGANANAAALRAVPAEAFGQLRGLGYANIMPIAGDTVLPKSIQATFAAGEEAALPLIVGSTSDDGSVASAFGIDPALVLKRLGAARILVKALYPAVKDNSEVARWATRDVVFTMPVRWIADRHSKLAPTWRYYFDYTAVADRGKSPNGVPHGHEIPYFLNTVDITDATKDIVTDDARGYARRISDYVVAFALTGRPASSEGGEWPDHRGGQDRTMIFRETIAVEQGFMKARLNTFIGVIRFMARILNRA